MRRTGWHIDKFSGGLGELPRVNRTALKALRVLSEDPRVSTFERGPKWLESLLHELVSGGLVVEDTNEPYPWHRYRLTDAGRKMLAEQQAGGPKP